MKAEQIQGLAKADPKRVAAGFTAALRKFGYDDVSQAFVEEQIQRWLTGEPFTGGPGLFVHRWLDKGTD